MTIHPPTLKQLQYFAALHDHGHFGRAAAACAVTQSTLSSGIQELEGLLGVVLVERNRRLVRFTPSGERIAAQARRVLREADELTDVAQAAGQPLTGTLRMSVIPTIAPFLLPWFVPQLREAYPDLDLFLREETSAAACERLAHGRVDCVLLALPFACGDVEQAVLFEDRLLAAYPAGESPTDAVVAANAIPTDQLLLLEDGHCLTDHALAACSRRHRSGDAAIVGTSLHTIVQMVESGLGPTMLPEMAVRAGILEGTRIETRAIATDQARRTIALVWRRGSPREGEFRLLASILTRKR